MVQLLQNSRGDAFGLLESPPFVSATDIGVTDALNVNGCIRVHLASPLNSFRLSWEYCTCPFRTRFSHRIISLLTPFDIHLIFCHESPLSCDYDTANDIADERENHLSPV